MSFFQWFDHPSNKQKAIMTAHSKPFFNLKQQIILLYVEYAKHHYNKDQESSAPPKHHHKKTQLCKSRKQKNGLMEKYKHDL